MSLDLGRNAFGPTPLRGGDALTREDGVDRTLYVNDGAGAVFIDIAGAASDLAKRLIDGALDVLDVDGVVTVDIARNGRRRGRRRRGPGLPHVHPIHLHVG
jgi:hypothetical protein